MKITFVAYLPPPGIVERTGVDGFDGVDLEGVGRDGTDLGIDGFGVVVLVGTEGREGIVLDGLDDGTVLVFDGQDGVDPEGSEVVRVDGVCEGVLRVVAGFSGAERSDVVRIRSLIPRASLKSSSRGVSGSSIFSLVSSTSVPGADASLSDAS